jgi:hypothetical protein
VSPPPPPPLLLLLPPSAAAAAAAERRRHVTALGKEARAVEKACARARTRAARGRG